MLRNVGLRKSVEQPVLDLNFAASQIGSNGAPDARMNDFNRGSNAWFVDTDGLVKKSPHNLIPASETFVHGASGWLIAGGSFEASSESPDGIDGSTKITWSTIGQTYNLVSGIVAGQTYQFSYYVKLGTKINNRYAVYDHTNSAFIISPADTSGVSSSEWTRVNFEVTAPSGCTQIRFYPDRADAGVQTGTTFITGVQVSQHSTLPVGNPYIKTDSSAVYAARLDHDASWFMSAAQEQNLLQYSEMLDDSYWTKSAVTVTANAETDPLGGTTAEYIFATSPSGTFPAVVVDFDVAKGVVHTLSFYAKKGERDRIHVDNQNPGPVFNENVISNAELTSEWQRFTGTFTPDENTSRLAFYFGSGAKTWSGDQGFYLWGLQVEVGSTASTYHRTEGAPYYGEGATPKGLLIEEQRANLIGYSEDFSASGLNPAQSPGGSLTLTHNDALAPDGTTTATKLVATSSGGHTGHLLYKVVSVANDTTATASVFMKNAGQRWAYLQLANTGYVSTKNVYVDLENGVLGTSDSSATIEDYGNGWYRVSVTNTTDSDGGNDVVAIGLANDDVDPIFTGDDTNGIYIWGWQKELGSFPTSYIKNTGTGATRNADVATMGPTTGGTELVTNGTFDTGTTGWNDFGGRSNISVSSGQLVVDVVDAGFGFVARTDVGGGYDPVVVPGRRYRLSADLKVNSGNGVEIDVYGSGSPIAATGVVTSGTLTTKTVDFTCPDGVTSVTLFVDNIAPRATTDEYVIDNVSVRELYPFEQFEQSQGTIVAEMTQNTLAGGSTYYPSSLVFQEGTGTDGIYFNNVIGGASDTLRYIYIASDGVAQVNGIGQTVASGTPFVHALSYAANDVDNFIDGSVPSGGQSDNSATLPHPDRISFNYSSKGAYYIKRMTYFNRKVSDDTLQFLSDV